MRDFHTAYFGQYIKGSHFQRIAADDSYLMLALTYASDKHHGVMRRGNIEPYVAHCFRVAERYAQLTLPDRFSKEVYAALLLHDVKEDCGVTNSDLQETGFTPRTIELVAGLSRYPWETRKTYVERILVSGDLELMVGKLCDTMDNMVVDPYRLDGMGDWAQRLAHYGKTQIALIGQIDAHLKQV